MLRILIGGPSSPDPICEMESELLRSCASSGARPSSATSSASSNDVSSASAPPSSFSSGKFPVVDSLTDVSSSSWSATTATSDACRSELRKSPPKRRFIATAVVSKIMETSGGSDALRPGRWPGLGLGRELAEKSRSSSSRDMVLCCSPTCFFAVDLILLADSAISARREERLSLAAMPPSEWAVPSRPGAVW